MIEQIQNLQTIWNHKTQWTFFFRYFLFFFQLPRTLVFSQFAQYTGKKGKTKRVDGLWPGHILHELKYTLHLYLNLSAAVVCFFCFRFLYLIQFASFINPQRTQLAKTSIRHSNLTFYTTNKIQQKNHHG